MWLKALSPWPTIHCDMGDRPGTETGRAPMSDLLPLPSTVFGESRVDRQTIRQGQPEPRPVSPGRGSHHTPARATRPKQPCRPAHRPAHRARNRPGSRHASRPLDREVSCRKGDCHAFLVLPLAAPAATGTFLELRALSPHHAVPHHAVPAPRSSRTARTGTPTRTAERHPHTPPPIVATDRRVATALPGRTTSHPAPVRAGPRQVRRSDARP